MPSEGVVLMGNLHYVKAIKKYLKEMGRPCNTFEIYYHINEKTKHGMMIKGLGNILAKNPEDFVRVGSDVRAGVVSGKYNVGLWDLSERVI